MTAAKSCEELRVAGKAALCWLVLLRAIKLRCVGWCCCRQLSRAVLVGAAAGN